MQKRDKQLQAFDQLLDIIEELREKCPWDRKQTMESLRHLTLEEVYELSDAITTKNLEEIKNELGDVLLHIVFYAQIASETKDFDIEEVINSLNEKLIHRHPHIYADKQVSDEEEVKKNWESLKLKEGKKSVLEGVPQSLPSLLKAYRIQEKVKGVGFEFENDNQTWEKVKEEIREFENESDPQKKEQEFGDVLFSLINYARFTGINPDDALEKTNQKFINRFQSLEQIAKQRNQDITKMSLPDMDKLWKESKTKENN